MNHKRLVHMVGRQRSFFSSGATLDLEWRRRRLQELTTAIESRVDPLLDAVYQDMRKPPIQTFSSEIAMVLSELRLALRKLDAWSRPRSARLPLIVRPATGWVESEPYGVTLIIGPWNNPLGLVLQPLVSAIAAGNCAILKPSEHAPVSSMALREMVAATFGPEFVTVAEGAAPVAQTLIETGVDYVFFTGSVSTGRTVMAAAAKLLTPVTLELGGQNPCVVEASAPLRSTARRIAWAKFFAAGQTCVAPDFVVADARVRGPLIEAMVSYVRRFYARDPKQSADYGRITDRARTKRLARLLDGRGVACGGEVDIEDNYVAPTIVPLDTWSDPLIAEEILGPVLPVLSYHSRHELLHELERMPPPLALYLFTRDRAGERVFTRRVRSGGVCINGCMSQIMALSLPFGGLQASGFGSYHGKAGFDCFSRPRSFLRRAARLEFVPAVYPPLGRWDMYFVRRWWHRFM
jgi:aldehyde dehydrogenase (NAD+)